MTLQTHASLVSRTTGRVWRHRFVGLILVLGWLCLPLGPVAGAGPTTAPQSGPGPGNGAPPPEIVNFRAARALIEKMQQDVTDLEDRAVQAYGGRSFNDQWGTPHVMTEGDIRANFFAECKDALAKQLTDLANAKEKYDKKPISSNPTAIPDDQKPSSGQKLAWITYDAVRAAGGAWWEAQARFSGIRGADKYAGFIGVKYFDFWKRYDDMNGEWFKMEQPRYALRTNKEAWAFDAKQRSIIMQMDVEYCDQQANDFRAMRDWLKGQRKWLVTNLWHWQAVCDHTIPDRAADSFKTHILTSYDNYANTRKNGKDPGYSVVCQEEGGTSLRYSPQSWHLDFGPNNPFLNGWADIRTPGSLGLNNNISFTLAGALAVPAATYNRSDSDVYDPVTMSPGAGAEEVCKNLEDRLNRLATLTSASHTDEKALDDCLARLDRLARVQTAAKALLDACHDYLDFIATKSDEAANNSIPKAQAARNDAGDKLRKADADLASRKSDLVVVCASHKDAPRVYFRPEIKDPKILAQAVPWAPKVAEYRKFAASNSSYQDVADSYNNAAQAISDLAGKALQPYQDAVASAINDVHEADAMLDQRTKKHNSQESVADRQKALSLWNYVSSGCGDLFAGENGDALEKCGYAQDLQSLQNRPQAAYGDDLITGPKIGDFVSFAARTAHQMDLLGDRAQTQFATQRERLGDREAARESEARAIIQCFYDVMNLRLIALDRAEEMASKSPEATARAELMGAITDAKTRLNNFLKPPKLNPTGNNRSDKETLAIKGLAELYPKIPKNVLGEDTFKKTGAIAKYLSRTENFDKFQKQWAANDPAAFATAFGLTTDLLPAVPVVGPLIGQALGYYASGFESCITAAKGLQDRIVEKEQDTIRGLEGTNASPERKFYREEMVRNLQIRLAPSPAFIADVTASFQIRRLMYLAGQSAPQPAH